MGLFSRVLHEFSYHASKGMKPFTYLLLEHPSGGSRGALVSYDKESALSFAEATRNGINGPLGTSFKGAVSASVFDQLGMAIPTLSTVLQTGNLYQFTASQAAMDALASGNATLVESKFGLSGIIRGLSGRFQESGGFTKAAVMKITTPLLVWQIIHVVFAVSHLQKINMKLEQILRGIEDLAHRSQAKTYGEIWASTQAVRDVLRQHEHSGVFTEDMRIRLAVASQSILSAIAEQSMLLQRYMSEYDQVARQDIKARNTKVALQTLRETSSKFQLDAHLYTAAGQASTLSAQAWILHDLQHSPENVERRLDDLKSDLDEIVLGVEPLKKYEELLEFASACANEMNWFQKNIFSRNTFKEAKGLEHSNNSSNSDLSYSNSGEASLFYWFDENSGRPSCIAISGE